MPAIPHVFNLQLWNLAVSVIFATLFLVLGFISLADKIKIMLGSSRQFYIRPI